MLQLQAFSVPITALDKMISNLNNISRSLLTVESWFRPKSENRIKEEAHLKQT